MNIMPMIRLKSTEFILQAAILLWIWSLLSESFSCNDK